MVLSLRDLFQTVFDLKRKQEAEASRGEAGAVATTTEGVKSESDKNEASEVSDRDRGRSS